MSFNDDFFANLQQFIDENADKYPSIDDAVEAYIEQYNKGQRNPKKSNGPISDREKSMDLLQEAMYETNVKKQRKLLKEAIKLWPDNYEAEILLAEGSVEEVIKHFLTVHERAHKNWLKTDQVGWLNFEERPYWQLKYFIGSYLFNVGMLIKAEPFFRDCFDFNEMDNLGARYHLMSIYARTYNWEAATEIYYQTPEASEDDMMVIPLMSLAVALGEFQTARKLLADLYRINPQFDEILKEDFWPFELLDEIYSPDQYSFNSVTTIANAIVPLIPLLTGVDYAYGWIKEEYGKIAKQKALKLKTPKQVQRAKKKKKDNVISFPSGVTTDFANNYEAEGSPLAGLAPKPQHILALQGLTSFEALAHKTQKEVAAIQGIGPRTIQGLLDNGVKFKKEK